MSDVTSSPPPTSLLSRPTGGASRTPLIFFGFYGLAVVSGLRQAYYWLPSGLDELIPLGMALCLGCWAVADSKRRGDPIPFFSRPWFFLFATFLVPGYIVLSLKWRDLGWVIFHGTCWIVVDIVAMLVGGTAIFGREWWRAITL